MSYVTVSLDDFDDDDILSAAFDIIKTAKSDSYLSGQIEAIRLILIPDNEEDSSIPPPSTASKIKSMDDLRAWQKRQIEGIA